MDDWKLMLIVAFHKTQVIAFQFMDKGKTVDHQVYKDFLANHLQPEVRRQRIHRPLILQDGASPHKHKEIKEFFNLHRWGVLRHPAYSPDLSPPDFDGIARIKKPHKGIRYATEAELIAAYSQTIYEINRKNEATGISHLPMRWEKVIQNEGEYIA
jgi:transposase